MGRCRTIFVGLVTGLLAFVFITAGAIKLTPKISVQAHKRMYRDFVQYAKLHPAVKFGYDIDPKKFMPQVGVVEVIAGTFLVVGPRLTRMICCLVLSSLMVGALYFVKAANKPREEWVVPAVVLFLTFIRFNLFLSPTVIVTEKEKKKNKKEKKAKKEQ